MSRLPVSHTRLEQFENCPYQFKRVTIDKVPQAKGLPLLVGGFFHEWAQVYVEHLLKTKQVSDYAAAEELFEHLWSGRSGHKEFHALPESAHEELFDLVTKFRETHVIEPDAVAGNEVELALTEKWERTTWMADDVFFRMKLDRLEVRNDDEGKTATIIDYKTGFDIKSEDGTVRDPQLRRYILGVSTILPADRYEVRLDYVRVGLQRKAIMAPGAAEEAKRGILAISDRIEAARKNGKWEATPGPACAFCPVFGECPSRKVAVQFRAPQSGEEAGALVQRLILLERETKDLKESLKDWIGVSGPVTANGMVYGPTPVISKEYDVESLFRWAAANGIDPMSVVKAIDKTGLQAAIRKTKDRAGAEASLAAVESTEKVYTTYRLKKSGDEAQAVS